MLVDSQSLKLLQRAEVGEDSKAALDRTHEAADRLLRKYFETSWKQSPNRKHRKKE